MQRVAVQALGHIAAQCSRAPCRKAQCRGVQRGQRITSVGHAAECIVGQWDAAGMVLGAVVRWEHIARDPCAVFDMSFLFDFLPQAWSANLTSYAIYYYMFFYTAPTACLATTPGSPYSDLFTCMSHLPSLYAPLFPLSYPISTHCLPSHYNPHFHAAV